MSEFLGSGGSGVRGSVGVRREWGERVPGERVPGGCGVRGREEGVGREGAGRVWGERESGGSGERGCRERGG